MLATDPLSLVFLGCAVFAGCFLVVTTLLGHGPHGHIGHVGHVGHVGHIGHVGHVGHVSHLGQAGHAGHAGSHAAGAHGSAHGPQTSQGAHATSSSAGEPAAPADAGGVWTAFASRLEGLLNVYGALTFLLIFGVLGYLLHEIGSIGALLSLLLAVLVGLACAMVVNALLTRIFLASGGGELTSENSRLEGRLGQVSMAIRGGGIGEVIYTGSAGGRQSVGARSVDGQSIAADIEVVILGYRDGIASVQPWDAFMASVRAGNPLALEPIDEQP